MSTKKMKFGDRIAAKQMGLVNIELSKENFRKQENKHIELPGRQPVTALQRRER